jgi:hypothetical protein
MSRFLGKLIIQMHIDGHQVHLISFIFIFCLEKGQFSFTSIFTKAVHNNKVDSVKANRKFNRLLNIYNQVHIEVLRTKKV